MQEKQIKINIEEYLDKLEKKISTNFQTSKLVTKEIAKIGNQKAKDSLMGKFPSHTKVRNIYFATLNSIITLLSEARSPTILVSGVFGWKSSSVG